MKTLEQFKEDMYLSTGEYGECFADYNQGYISDIINEIAGNNIDIYTYDLLEWAKENYEYIERGIDEYGVATDSNGRADFIGMIRYGQSLYIDEDLYNNLKDNLMNRIIEYLKENGIDGITEEQDNALCDIYDELVNYDTLEEIFSDVDDIFYKEAED